MPPGHIGGTHHQHTHQVVTGHVADQVTELFEEFPEQRPTRPLKHTMDLQTYILCICICMYILIYIYMVHMAYMFIYKFTLHSALYIIIQHVIHVLDAHLTYQCIMHLHTILRMYTLQIKKSKGLCICIMIFTNSIIRNSAKRAHSHSARGKTV